MARSVTRANMQNHFFCITLTAPLFIFHHHHQLPATNKKPKLHQHPTHIPNSPTYSNANSFPSCRLNFSLYFPNNANWPHRQTVANLSNQMWLKTVFLSELSLIMNRKTFDLSSDENCLLSPPNFGHSAKKLELAKYIIETAKKICVCRKAIGKLLLF